MVASTYVSGTYSGPISIPQTKTTTEVEWIQGPGGLKFFTKRWIPEGGDAGTKVWLVFHHGFVEHIQRYNHAFPIFAKKGVQVFAFDGRGFGETAYQTMPAVSSQGKTSWPQQLEDLDFFVGREVDRVKEVTRGKGKVILMGHSMGGGVVLAYSTRSPPTPHLSSLSAVVASAPLLRQPPKIAENLWKMEISRLIGKILPDWQFKTGDDKPVPEGQVDNSWRGDICRDQKVVKDYGEDPLCTPWGTYKGVSDMLLGGDKIVTTDHVNFPIKLPLLLIHGNGDKVTYHEATKEFKDRLKYRGVESIEYKEMDDYYHEMHNEPGDDKWTEIEFVSSWVLGKRNAQALKDK